MRLPAIAVLFTLALVGCGKDAPKNEKEKDKKADPVTGGPGGGPGPGNPLVTPAAAVAGMGSPPQQAAQQFVIDVRKPEAIDLNRVSGRFLKVIGKPLSPLPDDQNRKYNPTEANNWLKRAGEAMGGDAMISPTTGHAREGAAVFVGSYKSATAQNGRYLLRVVEEGGAWKLDWFQVSAADANDRPTELDPFKDFAAQAAADVVAGGPMKSEDRAPLAAAILSQKARAALDVNQAEDPTGYDYKRGILSARLETFLGARADSYTRSMPATDSFKVEFAVAGAKKTVEIKIVKGDGPGAWVVDEIKAQ